MNAEDTPGEHDGVDADERFSYAHSRRSLASGVTWSAVSVIGKQGILLITTLALARILGPPALGIYAQAATYVALTALLLDQGISAALISQPTVTRRFAGAAVTANLLLSAVLASGTFALAPLISDFFRTPQLAAVLVVLGAFLPVKAAMIVPRALLARSMDFRRQAAADVVSTVVACVAGVTVALAEDTYWALVLQSVVADCIAAVILYAIAHPPRPSLALGVLRGTLRFSSRALGGSFVYYAVQNVDNILVGRYLGASNLAVYSLSFRVLTSPVQLIGQSVTRVLFPAVAREAARGGSPARITFRSVQSIALISFPLMGLIAVSAKDAVPTVLGSVWIAAVPLLSLFAVGGARQSVTTVNTSVLMGMGRSDVVLRFSLFAAVIQISAIVIGLQFGTVEVALALTIAGFVLLPVQCYLQRRIGGFSFKDQGRAVWPALNATIWAAAAYLAVARLEPHDHVVALLTGGSSFVVVFVSVLAVFHRPLVTSALRRARRLRPGRPRSA